MLRPRVSAWAGDPVTLSDLAARTQATPEHVEPRATRPSHPKGYEPGFEWDGSNGVISTGPLEERPKTWDEFIRDAGLDPEEVIVLEPVQVRGWDMPKGEIDPETGRKFTSVLRAHYYRLNVRRRTLSTDLDDLIKTAKRLAKSTAATTSPVADSAFLVALGDLQIGKMDGDGPEGTAARFLAATNAAVARYKRVAKGQTVYLTHLGDCIEGMVSQGGANQWRTPMPVTEQVRLYRSLLLEQVAAFAKVAPQVVVAGIPGNHDEAHRPIHTYSDSWAIDALSAVRQTCEFAGNYDHVSFVAPARDELTVTLDMAGTIVGLAHGHQWRAGQHVNWWAKQAHGRQPIGDAHLLLSGHLHHLRVEQTGSDKTFLQVPALESGSQWWKHRTGEWGQPGVVTALVGGGTWRSLEIL